MKSKLLSLRNLVILFTLFSVVIAIKWYINHDTASEPMLAIIGQSISLMVVMDRRRP